MKVLRLALVFGSLLIFFASLLFPAVVFVPDNPLELETYRGWGCLVYGWTTLFVAWPQWLANPFYIGGIILIYLDVAYWALVPLLLGFVLAATTPLLSMVSELQTGYDLWLLSFLIAIVAAVLLTPLDLRRSA
jgi:hypothetical protein